MTRDCNDKGTALALYPLAGRLRNSDDDLLMLEVDCNGEGTALADGYVDLTVGQFMEALPDLIGHGGGHYCWTIYGGV